MGTTRVNCLSFPPDHDLSLRIGKGGSEGTAMGGSGQLVRQMEMSLWPVITPGNSCGTSGTFPPHEQQVAQSLALAGMPWSHPAPRRAVPVLRLGDSISQMLSSDGTAVRHRLTGTLSPTRLPFGAKQGVLASGAISSEDRLRLRCGPLQMPAENTETPVKGKIDRGQSSSGPTPPRQQGRRANTATSHLL